MSIWEEGLYDEEPYYREQIDKCGEILKAYLDKDIREDIYSDGDEKKLTSFQSN